MCVQVEAVANRYASTVPFGIVDTSELEELSLQLGVASLPSFGLYADGKLVATIYPRPCRVRSVVRSPLWLNLTAPPQCTSLAPLLCILLLLWLSIGRATTLGL